MRLSLYIPDEESHVYVVFSTASNMAIEGMKMWSTSLLLLLATTAIAKKDVLVVDQDESVGSLNHKDEPGEAQDEMSWEAAEALLDAVKEFGNITGNVTRILPEISI